MSSSTLLLVQKGLLGLTLTCAFVLLCFLARRKLGLYEETARARSYLIAGMLANVSEGLDRIEAGLDDIATRAAAAKARLAQLTATKRQNLLVCGLFRDKILRATAAEDARKRNELTRTPVVEGRTAREEVT